MNERFPSGQTPSLFDVTADDRITLSQFGGTQQEREANFRLATAFSRLHKKKLERSPGYDPADPAGERTNIKIRANELREAFAEASIIEIPESEDEPFVSTHLIITETDLPLDETNRYYRELIKNARTFIGG